MATLYIGTVFKKYNLAKADWDYHYLKTHVDAIEETDSVTGRSLLTQDQKVFLDALMGEGSGGIEDTPYGELVEKVNLISSLVFADDSSDEHINKLQEIIQFLYQAGEQEIGEGLTLTEFIENLNKLTVNNKHPFRDSVSIWSPTSAGTSGRVLVSKGAGNSPDWSSMLTVGSTGITVNGTATFSGATTVNGTATVQHLMPAFDGGESNIGGPSASERFGHIFASALNVTGQVTENGRVLSGMKNAVAGASAPTAADYERNSLVDGLIWLDTSGDDPASLSPAPNYNLTLTPFTGVDAANYLATFFSDPHNQMIINSGKQETPLSDPGTRRVTPLFEMLVTGDYLWRLCLEYYTRPMEPSSYLIILRRKNLKTEESEILWSAFGTVSGDGTIDDVYIPETSVTIPLGKVLVNNLHLAPRIFKFEAIPASSS